jgi:prepilin peptidase CpaA
MAAFLSLVVFEDVRSMRIPNALTFPALGLALAAAGASGGLQALGQALAGAIAALGVLLIPYALGWLGAGDVKAMAVLGALLGLGSLLPLLYYVLLAGGILALAFVAIRGELIALFVRWGLSLQTTLATRRLTYFPAPRGSAAAGALPFGVAMACGAIALGWFGAPR